jgi:hypothetical protein
MAAVMEQVYLLQNSKLVSFSEEQLNDCIGGNGCAGNTFFGGKYKFKLFLCDMFMFIFLI